MTAHDEPLLAGRVALVTGGGAGIGHGVAVQLANHGADVVIADIDVDRAGVSAELVRASGRRALAVATDVMDTAQIRAAVQAADDEFGRLDILVNNAGGVRARRFMDQSETSWRRHIDMNLVSMMAAIAAAVPVMARGDGGGSIVNVTSIEGLRAAPMFAVYGACKAGMISFTRTMALELSEHRIRVNAIAPDHTVTPGFRGQTHGRVDPSTWTERPSEIQEEVHRYIPLGAEGDVSQCGDAVVFLCSPMAAYITGVTLNVDGGTWAASGWSRAPDGGWRLYPGFGTARATQDASRS
jgi:NAD(P)-dependent dehydrogenase (short-subunit alcohol dehydrogenase family)